MDARPAPLTHLLYLHGFRSSPHSFKARMIAAHVAALNQSSPPEQAIMWLCPQLPPSPDEAVTQVLDAVADWPRERMAIIGSSLGGFYATALGERLGCRVAVINPAVAPARDLARYIGEQTSFHNPEDRFFFRPEFVPSFAALHPYPITRPERYWALISKGDEVLNWEEMVAHYPHTTMTVLPGSDHAVSDFSEHLPGLLQWLGWRP
ncbi:YqiA/YcfP family alpha/beta fold hydrolase [Aquabacterium sp. A3]|uniref:YqiA/YcfP family alpha/beta fold hydrolase n=1 Tax=Aquabacterium sp. A3 TaxID=3132829 RepID=UPI00311A670F